MLLNNEGNICIHGKYRREVCQIFGGVDIHWDYRKGKHITFSAEKVLPNFYCNNNAGIEPIEKNPLYVLIPDRMITSIWKGSSKPDEIRYGTAVRHKDNKVITPAIGIFKGKALLYICLNPVDEADVESLEVGSLGM